MRSGGVSVGSSRSVSSASPYDSTDRHSQFDDKSLNDECQLNDAPIFPIRSELHAQKVFRVQITRPHKIRMGKPVVRIGKPVVRIGKPVVRMGKPVVRTSIPIGPASKLLSNSPGDADQGGLR